MEILVKGKRVLITAAAAGIGLAMTDVFHKAGARVHICDVVQASLDDTVTPFPEPRLRWRTCPASRTLTGCLPT
jgi:NAD(P)-dependent dehydrogenase (short-subunit alcohol dehydrogenase family)